MTFRTHTFASILAGGLLAVAALSSCSHQERKNDLEAANLKGRVKQMTELINNHVADTLYREADPTEEQTEYDIMRVLDFHPNGLLKNIRLITENGTTVLKYEYDADSLLTGIQCFTDGALVSYDAYTYDSDGRRATRRLKDPSNNVQVEVSYRYDKHGNLTEEREKYSQEQMSVVKRYKYDRQGRMIEKTEARNGLDSKIVEKYVYDDRGEILEMRTEDQMEQGDPYVISQRYRYGEPDSLGNWTLRELYNSVDTMRDRFVLQRWERTIEYYEEE